MSKASKSRGSGSGVSLRSVSLDQTGIAMESEENLMKLYEEGPRKLLDYLVMRCAKYKSAVATYDAEKVKSLDYTNYQLDKILHSIESLICMERSLNRVCCSLEEGMKADVEALEVDIREVTEFYYELMETFKTKLQLLSDKAQAKADERSRTSAAQREKEKSSVDDEGADIGEDAKKNYKTHLPHTVPGFGDITDGMTIDASKIVRDNEEDKEADRTENSEGSDLDRKNREESEKEQAENRKSMISKPLTAMSTPLSTKQIRFSEGLNRQYTISGRDESSTGDGVDDDLVGVSEGVLSGLERPDRRMSRAENAQGNEDSWKYVEPKSTMIQEVSLVEDLQAVSKIVEARILDSLSDVELVSLDKRDVKELKALKESIEKKVSSLPDGCNPELCQESVKAFKAATRWISKVDAMLKHRQLHLQSDLKNQKPLELKAFKGHSDPTTNVYEFFSTYEIISSNYTSAHKAQFLFSNFLEDNIKGEVRHLRHDYGKMKDFMVSRHGNVNTLLSHKKTQIKALATVNFRSTRQEQMTYLKSYKEVLDQLISLLDINKRDYPLMRSELLSYQSVMELARLLPDMLFRRWNSAYVKETIRRDVYALPGDEAFEILVKTLKYCLSEVEHEEEVFYESVEKVAKDSKAIKPTKKGGVMNVGFAGSHALKVESYNGAPCLAHSKFKVKVRDCLSGQCDDFLSMKPEDRMKSAEDKIICTLCLLYSCKKNQNKGTCFFRKHIPEVLVCKDCEVLGKEINVLLCANHHCDKALVQEALKEFLPGYKGSDKIDLFLIGQFNKVGSPELKSKPGRICNDAFDVNTGERLPKEEIAYRLKRDEGELAIYPTQVLNVGGIPVHVLWDTGALGELIKEEVAEKLSLTVLDGSSQHFTVAGGDVKETYCPLYQLTLGANDRKEFFEFPCLGVKRISSVLKEIDLTETVDRVKKELVGAPESKEIFPAKYGGEEIQMILGTRLSHLFPTRLYVLSCGLQIWRSPLTDIYGSNLILSGMLQEPRKHSVNLVNFIPSFYQYQHMPVDMFTPIEDLAVTCQNSDVVEYEGNSVEDAQGDVKICSFQCCHTSAEFDDSDDGENESSINVVTSIMKKTTPRKLEQSYKDEEDAGATVDYRCSDCAPCKNCLRSDKVRATSIRESAEESLIWSAVVVDPENKITTTTYPFTADPKLYLSKKWKGKTDNYEMAKHILNTQRKKPAETRENVVKFNSELYERGFVSPLKEMSPEVQQLIKDSDFLHYFCWRSVTNMNSQTTSTRMVVDPTLSNFNDVVAKGMNSLTSLFQLILGWRSYVHVFCSDISKMFNTLQLTPEMYKYSLYLFSESLDPKEDIQIWLYRTLMYGIKSASGLATCGLKKTATLNKDECPLAYTVLMFKTYMDDSGHGSNTLEGREKIIDELQKVLPFGGFKLKMVTRSGEPPDEKASGDGERSSFGGYAWKCVNDTMLYKSGELNFNVKRRGYKQPNKMPVVTTEDVRLLVEDLSLTRRNLLGKVLEQFDLIGLFEPLRVRYKIDLSLLAGLDYDFPIKDALREKWVENLMIMHESKNLECIRSVVHPDTLDPDELELICCADAALVMAGCVLYVRTKLRDGSYSVRMLTARSKTTRLSIPRNELVGCMLCAETAFIAVKSLDNRVAKIIFCTDSAIALCWLNNEDLKLKQFVFSRVMQTRRLIGASSFYLVPGSENPADLVTRGECNVDDVQSGSLWQDGPAWMYSEFQDMPLRSYEKVCEDLTPQDVETVEHEAHPSIPGVNYVHDGVLDEERPCWCIQTFDNDIVNTISNVCTGSCKLVEVGHGLCGLESVCPTINIVKSEPTVKKNTVFSIDKKGSSVDYLVDFIRLGFRKAFLILAYVQRYITKLRHKAHQRKGIDSSDKCPLCVIKCQLSERQFIEISEKFKPVHTSATCTSLDFHLAWKNVCRKGSKEVRDYYRSNPSKLKKYDENDGILYGAGRLDFNGMRIETEPGAFPVDYYKPVFLNNSVVTYALVMHMHWDPNFCPHSGVGRLTTFVMKVIHVSNISKIIRFVKDTCARCRYLFKRHYLPISGNQSIYSIMRAPPFFSVMCDIAGNFDAFDSVKRRVKRTAYFLVQVCMTTGATTIGVLEDLSTKSVVLALRRTADRYGYPKYVLLDGQTSFKALENMRVSFKDLQGKLWSDQSMILDYSTPHAHQEHGRVEAKVKVMKDYLNKAGELGRKHSFIEWESLGLNISSMINGLPICHNQDDSAGAYGDLNLITPNMFLIGRMLNRAPENYMEFDINPGKALRELRETNLELYNLLGDYVTRFIPGVKYSTNRPPEVGDVVLLLMKEAQRTRNTVYKYGRIVEVFVEGRQNKVLVEYTNATESVKRTVHRSVSNLVLILGSNEISYNTYEHSVAAMAQRKYL